MQLFFRCLCLILLNRLLNNVSIALGINNRTITVKMTVGTEYNYGIVYQNPYLVWFENSMLPLNFSIVQFCLSNAIFVPI